MTPEFITACAAWATGTGKPMAYLDAVLKDLAARDIRTWEAAERDHQQRSAQKPAAGGAARQPRQLREQQYEQREYTNQEELPDWMREMLDDGDGVKHDPQ